MFALWSNAWLQTGKRWRPAAGITWRYVYSGCTRDFLVVEHQMSSSCLCDAVFLRTCSNIWCCDLWWCRVWSCRSLRTGWNRRKQKLKKLKRPTCPNTVLLQTWVETKLPWWWAQQLGIMIHRTSRELYPSLWLLELDFNQFNQFSWWQKTALLQPQCFTARKCVLVRKHARNFTLLLTKSTRTGTMLRPKWPRLKKR